MTELVNGLLPTSAQLPPEAMQPLNDMIKQVMKTMLTDADKKIDERLTSENIKAVVIVIINGNDDVTLRRTMLDGTKADIIIKKSELHKILDTIL